MLVGNTHKFKQEIKNKIQGKTIWTEDFLDNIIGVKNTGKILFLYLVIS